MKRQYYFISGLPRSGSTLLVNILNQNPDIYASGTSGLLQIIKPIVTGWDGIAEFKANSIDENKKGLLQGLIDGFYSSKNESIVFDKCRGWPANIELLKYIGIDPKIILCVRDTRDILSSWERMYRNDKLNGRATLGEQENPLDFQTVESRCEFWSSNTSPLGSAFNIMNDAIHRKLYDNMCFFEFEKWTTYPDIEFKKLYEWLGLDFYHHDFNKVKQVINEKDEYYGYADLHNIKEGKVLPYQPKWPEYLTGELSKKYISSNIWSVK